MTGRRKGSDCDGTDAARGVRWVQFQDAWGRLVAEAFVPKWKPGREPDMAIGAAEVARMFRATSDPAVFREVDRADVRERPFRVTAVTGSREMVDIVMGAIETLYDGKEPTELAAPLRALHELE